MALETRDIDNKGNLIRDIGDLAIEVQKAAGVVALWQLGNPSTEQFAETKAATHASIDNDVSGYDEHRGKLEDRERLAAIMNDAEGVDHFTVEDVALFPGATSITSCLIKRLITEPNVGKGVLVSRPGYGTYETQTEAVWGTVMPYTFDDEGFVTLESVDRAVAESGGAVPKLLIVTLPHNPKGTTFDEEGARRQAAEISNIHEKYPDMVIYNDPVYAATVEIETGYHSIYPHLSESAQKMTVTGYSGAKMSAQGKERIGAVACINPEILVPLNKVAARRQAGTQAHGIKGFLAAGEKLKGTWRNTEREGNPRAIIADHYQSRIKLVADTFMDIDRLLRENDSSFDGKVPPSAPKGAMYYWYDVTDLVKGQPVPEAQLEAIGKDTFETGEDFGKYLMARHLSGHLPVAVCHGKIFNVPGDGIEGRISAVDRNMDFFREGANSIRTAIEDVRGLERGTLGGENVDLKDLEKRFGAESHVAKATSNRGGWGVGLGGTKNY